MATKGIVIRDRLKALQYVPSTWIKEDQLFKDDFRLDQLDQQKIGLCLTISFIGEEDDDYDPAEKTMRVPNLLRIPEGITVLQVLKKLEGYKGRIEPRLLFYHEDTRYDDAVPLLDMKELYERTIAVISKYNNQVLHLSDSLKKIVNPIYCAAMAGRLIDTLAYIPMRVIGREYEAQLVESKDKGKVKEVQSKGKGKEKDTLKENIFVCFPPEFENRMDTMKGYPPREILEKGGYRYMPFADSISHVNIGTLRIGFNVSLIPVTVPSNMRAYVAELNRTLRFVTETNPQSEEQEVYVFMTVKAFESAKKQGLLTQQEWKIFVPIDGRYIEQSY